MSISFSILHHFYLLLPICLLSNIEWIVYIKYFDTYTVSYMLNPIWFTFIKIYPRENSKLISDLYICFHRCPFFILLIPFVYILFPALSLFFSCWLDFMLALMEMDGIGIAVLATRLIGPVYTFRVLRMILCTNIYRAQSHYAI